MIEGPCEATRDEIVDSALVHYRKLSDDAHDWCNTVEYALEAYRRTQTEQPICPFCNKPVEANYCHVECREKRLAHTEDGGEKVRWIAKMARIMKKLTLDLFDSPFSHHLVYGAASPQIDKREKKCTCNLVCPVHSPQAGAPKPTAQEEEKFTRCCCGDIQDFTEPVIKNDTRHERLGIDGNFCGPTYKHELRDLRAEVARYEAQEDEGEKDCDNCEWLQPKEYAQSDKKYAHVCTLRSRPVKHEGQHPRLPRPEWCVFNRCPDCASLQAKFAEKEKEIEDLRGPHSQECSDCGFHLVLCESRFADYVCPYCLLIRARKAEAALKEYEERGKGC